MDKADVLIKGVPTSLMTMFRGFCSIERKNESEGMIDVMIDYIEKNTGGDKANLKKVIEEYRKSIRK